MPIIQPTLESENADDPENNDSDPYALFEELQTRKFDPETPPERKPPALMFKGSPIIRRGNVSTLQAAAKAGKSHVLMGMIRAKAQGIPTLGFHAPKPGKVLYLDFEQDEEDFYDLLKNQAVADSEMVKAYCLRGMSALDAYAAVYAILQYEPDIELVLFDGFADLMSDVNEADAANGLVARLMNWTREREIAIVGVIHLNPGSDTKSRGHLGSQLERKAETVLQIDSEGDTRLLWTYRARKKPVTKENAVRFAWDDQAGGFVELEGTPEDAKMESKREELTRLLQDVQADTGMLAWKFSELVEAIKEAEAVTKRTAQRRIVDLCNLDLVKHDSKDGVYTSVLGDKKGVSPHDF